jgi:hypothetical protein
MGRALKIQKYGTAQGITINANGTTNQPAAGVPVDIGYPNFNSLTDPVYNLPVQTLSGTDYLGVVGGLSTASTSTTNPIILPQVNILLADNTSTGGGAGRLIRQKGAHKFLVAYVAAATADESFIVGQAYSIAVVGTTNWAAIGAGSNNVAIGDIFTATGVGSGSGTAYPVGQCVLANAAVGALTPGQMNIEYSVGDSAAVYASYITNKWIRDWNGMTYDNYSNSNLGPNVYTNENFYPVNFFTDEGTVTWSGAEIINSVNAQNGSLQLAQVVKTTV